MPTILLVTDRRGLRRQVDEDEPGHNALLRATLRAPGQVAYFFADARRGWLGADDLTIFLDAPPPPEDARW